MHRRKVVDAEVAVAAVEMAALMAEVRNAADNLLAVETGMRATAWSAAA